MPVTKEQRRQRQLRKQQELQQKLQEPFEGPVHPNLIEAITATAEHSRVLQRSVEEAFQRLSLPDPLAADAIARAATSMAKTIHVGLQQNAQLLRQLSEENARLRQQLDEITVAQHSDAAEDDEYEDDDRSFGTHIREAIAILRGR